LVKLILPLRAYALTLPSIGFALRSVQTHISMRNYFEMCVCTLLKANPMGRRVRACVLKGKKKTAFLLFSPALCMALWCPRHLGPALAHLSPKSKHRRTSGWRSVGRLQSPNPRIAPRILPPNGARFFRYMNTCANCTLISQCTRISPSPVYVWLRVVWCRSYS
jgi:hypothetical protein